MIDELLFWVTFAAALASGLIAGVFFAFSSLVMKALARLPSSQGIAAMQSINVVVLNPIFLSVFVGTAVACVALIVSSLLRWRGPAALAVVAGGLLYLVGTFLVTMACNVPRNDALAAVDATSANGATLWARYVIDWTLWNHVRTATALAAAAAFTVARSFMRHV